MPNMRKPLLLAALAAAVAGTGGCVSTVALDRAVLAYDATATESVAKQLLLNIARARHNEPMHFTAISSIAATYRFAFSAGVGGALTGDRGNLLIPLVSSSAEENPTISISPMQGEEFTQRLLTPFQEQKLTLLLRQRYDVDALLRLMAAELQLKDPGAESFSSYFNRPADKTGYPVFRRAMAHLSSVQDRYALRVEPLHFQYLWTVPADALTPETYSATYKDFASTYDAAQRTYQVSKRVNGRVIITNYDPAVLPNDERSRLHAEAEEVPANDILLDIRAGHPGGELPMRGRLRLRSFHEILSFVGRGMVEEPEYDVPPDPRTPTIGENPVSALQIVESAGLPPGPGLSVAWRGNHFAVQEQSGYQWNKKAFSLLYQLFQMSVATAKDVGPAITIAK